MSYTHLLVGIFLECMSSSGLWDCQVDVYLDLIESAKLFFEVIELIFRNGVTNFVLS